MVRQPHMQPVMKQTGSKQVASNFPEWKMMKHNAVK